MSHQGYGFCEFLTEDDAEYACKIMNQIKLYGKPIRVNKVRLLGFFFLLGASGFWTVVFLGDVLFENSGEEEGLVVLVAWCKIERMLEQDD